MEYRGREGSVVVENKLRRTGGSTESYYYEED
jgi:hypothetical protein